MSFGIIVFPGSNCDHDCYHAIKHVIGGPAEFIWHKEEQIPQEVDAVVLPGGFSYGDYLRTGAIARFSPVMKAVQKFAAEGGLVIGICNGFQILLEVGLLPGAMLRNKGLKFICKDVYLKVENSRTPFTNTLQEGTILRIPIAHGEGNYFIDPDGLKRLEGNGQIIFKYCDSGGQVTDEANPNGSLLNIAGISNEKGNVLGMMPHPERCSESILGNTDGQGIFRSMIRYLKEARTAR